MSRFDCMFIRTSLYLLLEPLHWFLLRDQMLKADTALFPFSFSNIETRPSQHHIEIHTINPNAGVVFDSKINVLLDSKTKVPSTREVFLCQLVFTNLPIMKQANLLAKYNLPCYSTTVETQSTEVQREWEKLDVDQFWKRTLTFKPFSRISSALAPRTVQCTAIFSFRRMPNERTVYRAKRDSNNKWCQ